MTTNYAIIVFVWSAFVLLSFLMSYAAYRVLKGNAELQTELQAESQEERYIEDKDFWIWGAITMSVHDLLTFLKERNDLKYQPQGCYCETNCIEPKHLITDSFVLPLNMESQNNVTAPVEMLEEIARELGIKPQEALQYLAKKRSDASFR